MRSSASFFDTALVASTSAFVSEIITVNDLCVVVKYFFLFTVLSLSGCGFVLRHGVSYFTVSLFRYFREKHFPLQGGSYPIRPGPFARAFDYWLGGQARTRSAG